MDVNGEKEIIKLMIGIYCKKKHKQNTLCNECSELLEYASNRIDYCPRKNEKTFCSTCHIHCYKKDKREAIRNVMKFSGPRMLFHRPILALKHVYDSRKMRG